MKETTSTFEGQLRVTQVITIALVMGVGVFFLFCLMVNRVALDGGPNAISWIALGFFVVVFVLHLILPKLTTATALKSSEWQKLTGCDVNEKPSKLFPLFQTQHIIGCALLESAGFFNAFAYQTTQYMGNVIATVAVIALILMKWPTRFGVESWLADRARELENQT